MDTVNPQAQQSPAVRAPERWPLVQQVSTRNGTLLQDARLVNAYGERQQDGNWQVYKRPGLQGYEFNTAQVARGLIYPTVYVTGINAYAIYSTGNVYFVGPGTAAPIAGFTVDGSAQYTCITIGIPTSAAILFQNGTHAYYIPISGALHNMTGVGGFPSGTLVPGWAYLDGTTYVMDTLGNIWGSNFNDFTTWNGTNVIVANSSPDLGVGLLSYFTYVLAFKQFSTNVFYDAGNPTGSPLSPVSGALISYGCVNGFTIQKIDDRAYWVAVGPGGLLQIGALTNLQFSIVSTPEVDRLLAEMIYLTPTSTITWSSWVCKTGGHRFYGVGAKVVASGVTLRQVTLVYDIDQNLWSVWTDYTGNNQFPVQTLATYPDVAGSGLGNPAGYVTLGQDPTNGMIYKILPNYDQPVDASSVTLGAPFVNSPALMDIYTPNYDAGTRRRKHLNFMFFNADKYPGSLLKSRWNDRDYAPTGWSNFREVDLSAKTPVLSKNGTFRRRAYNWRHQSPYPFRISSVDLQMDVGTL